MMARGSCRAGWVMVGQLLNTQRYDARREDMKPFTMLAVAFLAMIALAQLTRFLLGWEVTIGGFVVPVWLSGIAFVIAGGIAVLLWRESRQ